MKKLTRKQAKKLSIKVWQYLFDNPIIESKLNLPHELFKKIDDGDSFCPLCEVLAWCIECPLDNCGHKSLYFGWKSAKTQKTRKKYAELILEKIKGWDV